MGRRKTQQKRNCLSCGKEFSFHAYRATEAKFCSRQCYDAHRTTPVSSRLQIKVNDYGCWEWTGYRSPEGYGKVGTRRRSQLAHRAVYEELRGPIPKNLVLDHRCRNRACVNPDHLREVTPEQNTHLGKVMRAVFAWRGIPDPSR